MKTHLYFGYDPGGNGNHGVAALSDSGTTVMTECSTLASLSEVISWFEAQCTQHDTTPLALGVDTLTMWSTARSGDRPAEKTLRRLFGDARNSIASPNSLRGSMIIGGGAAIGILRSKWPELLVTETHPKVLYLALSGLKYEYANSDQRMDRWLANEIGASLPFAATGNEHEWDALVSAHAAREARQGRWTKDLHADAVVDGDLVAAFGKTIFAWPPPRAPDALAPIRATATSNARRSKRIVRSAAIDQLRNAGHTSEARALEKWRNAAGSNQGWDAWLRKFHPTAASVLWP